MNKPTVVIGGGAIGLSVAYHLGKRGQSDVILLERNQLTSGTSWHAAGIVGPLRASQNLTELARYGIELFAALEEETGQATGYQQTGGVWLAQSGDRMLELHRLAAMGRMHNLGTHVLNPHEISARLPLLRTDDLVGGLWVDEDGQINPVDLCMAYAKGARQHGVEIREGCGVVAMRKEGRRVVELSLDDGTTIVPACVVNCAGLWAREIGLMADVNVPLRAVEHIYIVTESVKGLLNPCPIIRDLDQGIYIKGDVGKLVLGTFEDNPKLWNHASVDPSASFLEFDADWNHAEPMLAAGVNRIAALETVGVARFMNGPESFTPDTRQVMGRAPALENFYVAAGFNSIGIMSSAGVGKVMADWVIDQHPPMDIWEVDLCRFSPEDNEASFLDQRIPEAVHNQFQIHWPLKQYCTGRNRKRSVWHAQLAAAGAVFGAPTGWERPLWFAADESERALRYSYGAQSWWHYAQREALALESRGGVFELSPFSKFLISGAGASQTLNRLCSNRVSRGVGRSVYTLMLNQRAGIEIECTVTRVCEDQFLVVSGAATRWRDRRWIEERLLANTVIVDVTDHYHVLGIMGPESDALLWDLVGKFDLPRFGQSVAFRFGKEEMRANRLSYVGERGYELYIPVGAAETVIECLLESMAVHDIGFAGHLCLDSCRLEKGFAHWGHDIGPDDNPFAASLMHAVALQSGEEFIGRGTLVKLMAQPLARQRVLLEVRHDTQERPLLLHDEPIFLEDRVVGRTTSGGNGFRTGKALSMAWAESSAIEYGSPLSVELAGKRWSAHILSCPPYDPEGLKMRGGV